MVTYRLRLRGSRQRMSEIEQGISTAPEIVADELLMAVESPISPWPVLTGLSKNSFFTEVDGFNVSLNNTTDYAHVVEERTGAAREAWNRVDKDEVRQRITEQANGR